MLNMQPVGQQWPREGPIQQLQVQYCIFGYFLQGCIIFITDETDSFFPR